MLSNLFQVHPNHDGYGFLQLCFLGCVYGYILMYGSNMIKDGSELLLLVPSLAGVVGSIVLPVLGAVPDGAIVIFSGMNPDLEKAKEQIAVGIGALAGSTIMLLTVPWILSLWGGRVNLDADGNANYVRPKGAKGWKKLDPPSRIMGSGINCGGAIKYSSKVMLITTIPFFIIQVPALVGACAKKADINECHSPKIAGLIGGIFATVLFFYYLWDQARIADVDEVKEDKIDQLRANAVKKGFVSLRGLFPDKVMDNQGLVHISADNKRFQAFLKPFFRKYDSDNSGAIEKEEFSFLIQDLGEKMGKEETVELMKYMDKDNSGAIEFNEFCIAMAEMLKEKDAEAPRRVRSEDESASRQDTIQAVKKEESEVVDEEEEDEEEEPEVPEDLANLSPKQQQRKILMRSFWQMGLGVGMVLLFSDPMVDVLSQLGDITHIPPFYVAFIIAPLASNASELIAAYAYSQKKTEKTITISFASLIGAACMNNSFCLCLFLYLVWARDIPWTFTAETISILFVELVMFVFCQFRVHPMWFGFIVISLFPASVALVASLEAAGLD